MKKISIFLFFMTLMVSSIAQQNNVLFTLDETPVSVEEFERVYTKNNINNQADYSKASLDEYLDLFVNFKLKVAEAEALQLDTIPAIKNELATYQKQLVQNYATDKEVSAALLKEAYDRMKVEVDASHLLILWPNSYPTAKDSAKVLSEITKLRNKMTVDNFAEFAQKNSQDPSAKENKGRLGYLSVFQTVYPFENALYATKVGEISKPVATQFGYHLVLVHDKREARGKITTAHLLIKSKATDSEAQKLESKEKVFEIYEALVNKEYDFDSAVKQYSEDKKTKYQGGKLPELSSSEMIKEFAEAAFSIEEDGGIAEPVLTSIGWHIIKRLSKNEIPPFAEASNNLSDKISRDSRSNVAQAKNLEDSKKKFGYSLNAKNLESTIKAIESSFENGRFQIQPEKYNKELFTIGEASFNEEGFIKYAKSSLKNQKDNSNLGAKIRMSFDQYQNAKVQQYREEHLAEINEDYKHLLQEYHDGILLFELTDREVWSKAVMDTTGLRMFHEANKTNYMWKERAVYNKFSFDNEKAALKGIKLLDKGKSPELVLTKLNKKSDQVKMETFKQEKANLAVESLEWKEGASVQMQEEDGKVLFYKVTNLIEPEAKQLGETRGYVISDYQNYLEKQWISELKSKYEIKLNKDVFDALIKK